MCTSISGTPPTYLFIRREGGRRQFKGAKDFCARLSRTTS